MGKVIVFTGTPGTGKTSLCNYIVKRNKDWVHLDLGSFAVSVNAIIGYDRIMKSSIINMRALKKALRNYVLNMPDDSNLLIDGHYAAEVSPANCVDCCIVLRCRPDILWKRLIKIRGYEEKKARINIESELTDYCYLTAKRYLRNVRIVQFDTSNTSIVKLYRRFMKCYENDFKCEGDDVDWISYFSKHPEKFSRLFH
ncbi:MAG: AAA family ATPase [Thermoproteota archaeon]|nr:AAA family ATPase [Candidatus Brockarchaeota archaeon]